MKLYLVTQKWEFVFKMQAVCTHKQQVQSLRDCHQYEQAVLDRCSEQLGDGTLLKGTLAVLLKNVLETLLLLTHFPIPHLHLRLQPEPL